MVDAGLLNVGDPQLTIREIDDFKVRIEGADLLLWLEQLLVFPTRMDHKEQEQARDTLLGKCRQWTRAHKKREETWEKPKAAADAFLPAKAQGVPRVPEAVSLATKKAVKVLT